MRIRGQIIACVVLAVINTGAAVQASESLGGAKAQQIDALFHFWDRDDRPGATVAVARGGKVLFQRGYGLANVEHGVPNRPETLFNAGSIAKQFTALAVHLLVQDGRLSLDDEVRDHIPELPDFKREITLRHLVHHTSGLRDFWALADLAGWHPDDARTKDQFFELLGRQKTLNFDPGAGFSYSNSGYILLAEIIERVTGGRFSVWMEENVFEPLGMKAALVRASHNDIVHASADSYVWQGREIGFKRGTDTSSIAGSGNLFVTAGDLLRWGENLISGRIWGQALAEDMREQGQIQGQRPTGYASGLFVGRLLGFEAISHGGSSAGYRSHLLIIPERHLVVVVLANASNVRADIAAQKIASIVLPPAIADDEETHSEAGESVDLRPIEAYLGRYELADGLFYDIKQIEGGLIIQPSGGAPRLLVPISEKHFASEEAGVRVAFSSRRGGRFKRLAVSAGGRVIKGMRIETLRLARRRLRDYEGTYHCDELGATYRLMPGGGVLIIRRPRVDDIALTAIGEDRFYDEETGEIVIRFKRNPFGRLNGFVLSTERAKGLVFRKQ